MINNLKISQVTPSVHFNFSPSQSITPLNSYESVPYEYSKSISKKKIITHQQLPMSKKIQFDELEASIQASDGKIKTEELFDQFDSHFVVKFDDEVETFQDNNPQAKKHCSNIEQTTHENVENQEQNIKNKNLLNISSPSIKKFPKKQFQIHKRIVFKNKANLNKSSKSRIDLKSELKDIIKQENLLLVTSKCRTGAMGKKNSYIGSKTVKNTFANKSMIKNSFFHTHGAFKETLRSTTLNHWRQRHMETKKSILDKKKVQKQENIFQKQPFRLR